MRFPGMGALVGALGAVVLLALPASAAADTYVAQTPQAVLRLSVPGSHGYRISVTNEGHAKRVILTARKGNTKAIYSVHGRASGDRIVGNFGKLGKLSVRFQLSSQKPKRHRVEGCKGKPTTIQAGRFVGTIRFEGEEGFSSVSADSAKGTIVHKYKRTCTISARARRGPARQSAARNDSGFIVKEFIAAVVDRDHSVFVNTVNVSPPDEEDGFTLGEAAVVEHRGRITIGRSAEIDTEVDPVQTSPLGVKPLTGTVTLPAPLEGTGSFIESPGSPPSWTGDLRVSLPGGGVVPLTGPEFKAILCHGSDRNEKLGRCTDKAGELSFRADQYPLFL